jgi:hypothetical protein
MKALIILLLSCGFLKANCQNKKVFLEYHIVSIIDKGHEVKFKFPHVITMTDYGSTPIESLWALGEKEYGIKLQLIKSNVGLDDDVIVAYCLYIREENAWRELFKHASLKKGITKKEPNDFKTQRGWAMCNDADENNVNLAYMERIFLY